MTGIVGDLIGINRRLTEDVLRRMKDISLIQKEEEKVNNKILEYTKSIREMDITDARIN
jgi:uncharacterized protein YlzI (FlbEa/FlbD family)